MRNQMHISTTAAKPGDKKRSQREILRDFWAIAGPERKTYMVAMFLNVIVIVTELLRPLIQLQALTEIEQSNRQGLVTMAWAFFAVVVADYIVRSGFGYIFSSALLKTTHRMRELMFRQVLSMKMAYFDKQPVGSLLTRTINDCETLGETLRAGSATIVMDFASIVVTAIVLIKIDAELTLWLTLSAPPLVLSVRYFGGKLRKTFVMVRTHLATSNGFMAEGIMGVEILQLFGQRQSSNEQYRSINEEYRRATTTNNFYDAFLFSFIDAIANIMTAIILFAAFNLSFDVLNVATAILFLTQLERIFMPIRMLSSKLATLQQAMAALERIFGLLKDGNKIPQGTSVLEGNQLTIQFKDVFFKYGPDSPPVLRGINLTIEPGKTVALVGQTGSGKTTITKLLTRAYDGYQGAIEIAGQELQSLNYHSLRSKIAMVQQDVELFPGSLRDNISMFNEQISDEQILAAIKLVKAQHLVEELPGGLDFEVQEHGGNLSSGQKQLIVFARALAHDAPVVLMDEATSSVDSVTEAWIQEAIAQIMKHKTVLVVAHRLSTISAADKILVLKAGEIIEQGTHQQLLAIHEGYYANLVASAQFHVSEKHLPPA